ncbi:MAG: tRNA lysidine(34) synthetase TilS [Chitinophagaceae bacterium]|nr:tRNA lysidine(34) synthetase TilS [Chitinophagaceae bacterium]
MDLEKKVHHYWQKNGFPGKNQAVLVAVSGGRDSMALATLLHQSGSRIALAHCNFQLRGSESDLDQQLIEDWAQARNIRLHTIAFDTRKAMEEQHTGVQETARTLRYDWFHTLIREFGYAAVATAHHAQDNAETLLINFCKGTGMAGLHGIPPKNGAVIRPLLFATREEINTFVTEKQIPYREDASNASVQYLRNAVRHQVLPVLESVFPHIVSRLNENITRFTQAEDIYRQAIAVKAKKLVEQRGADFYIPVLKLSKETALETVCFELLAPFGFSPAQVPEILKLLHSESGHYISSATHRLIRNRMFLVITAHRTEDTDLILIDQFPASLSTSEATFSFRTAAFRNRTPDNAADEASLDLDKIRLPLVLRRWRTGDYFYPLGMGMKKKKLGRFLIDQKVPLHQKERLWVLESDRKIIWIAGMRIDERFKLTEATKNVLQIKMTNA